MEGDQNLQTRRVIIIELRASKIIEDDTVFMPPVFLATLTTRVHYKVGVARNLSERESKRIISAWE